MNNFQERLKEVRGKESQANFASSLGITLSSFSRYERGESMPDLEFIQKICSKFDVCPDWLVLGRGPMHPEKSSTTPEKAPESAPQAACQRCMELEVRLEQAEKALEEERLERRDLSNENRRLWKENAELREHCARLEERMEKPAIGRCPQKTGMAG